MLVESTELPCFKYDSYINTAMVCTFGQKELDQAEKKDVLPGTIIEKIRDTVTKHKYLPEIHKQTVLKNLISPKSSIRK